MYDRDMAETETYGTRDGLARMGRDVITLPGAIEEAQVQTDKLVHLITELANRLEPVRRMPKEVPVEPRDEMAKTRPEYGSPYAEKVDSLIAMLKLGQTRLDNVLTTLDV